LKLNQLALAIVGFGASYGSRSPHVRLHDLERVSGRATLAIAVGIGIEVFALFLLEPSWDLKWICSLVADLLIFIGLLVEYLVILETIEASKADRIESDREVANAMNRAAQAERDLLDHKTPRRAAMTTENKAFLVGRLMQFDRPFFDVGMAGGPGEVIHFCWDLEEVLHQAGWQQLDWGSSSLTFARNLRPVAGMIMADNVEIQIEPSHRTANIGAVTALVEALREIGISAEETPYNFANTNVQAIHVLIGPKL
jgi:hypothetical protein